MLGNWDVRFLALFLLHFFYESKGAMPHFLLHYYMNFFVALLHGFFFQRIKFSPLNEDRYDKIRQKLRLSN